MKISAFTDLRIWQQARELTVEIYRLTQTFPGREIYGLTSQLRRSSVSVPANIAEGFGRNSTKELINFLSIARGSVNETVCHCMIADDLGFMNSNEAKEVIKKYDGLGAGIYACITKLKRRLQERRAVH